jgi:SAM-dependent methyltransferase
MELRRHYDEWHAAALTQPAAGVASRDDRRFYDWIVKLLAPAPDSSLLDVGCGAGGFVEHAAALGLDVVGTDLSAVAVEAARVRVPAARFEAGDAEALVFEDDFFDHVTCLGSLEHFPHPAVGAAEMRRVLAPGGRAVVFVPNLFFLGHIWFGLRHGQQPTEGGQGFSEENLSSGGWRALLEGAGFEIVAVRPWNRIHASERVSPLVKRFWNAGARFVPVNGSYAFAFVCTKR